MTFTFATIKARVKLGVLRTDVEAASNGYGDFINTARMEFQNKHSFIAQRKTATVTILNGTSSIALPADFKELQPVKSPINFVLYDPLNPGAVAPITVAYEIQEIRRLWLFGGPSMGIFDAFRVFLKLSGTSSIIGTEIPAVEDLPFRVDYIAQLPDLSAPTDTCPITNAYPEMVIAKAKSLALASINDPAADGLETFAEKKFKEACIHEARKDLVGRELRM